MLQQTNWSLAAAWKWLGAALLAHWGGMPSAVQLLIALMVCDFFTGLGAGIVQKRLSSAIGFRGIIKKLLILLLLLVIHIVEQSTALPIEMKIFGMELKLATIGSWAFIVNELISIVENCANAGVPIPEQWVAALLNAKKLRRIATKKQLQQLGDSEPDGVSDRRER